MSNETRRCTICGYKLDGYGPLEKVCGACLDTFPEESDAIEGDGMRKVVSEFAEYMEQRFAEFDGVKRMGPDDDATTCIEKAIQHLEDWIADPEAPFSKLTDAANRIALAAFVLEYGITDKGVND